MSLSPWLTLSVIGRTPVYIITLLIFVALQIPAALTSNFVRPARQRFLTFSGRSARSEVLQRLLRFSGSRDRRRDAPGHFQPGQEQQRHRSAVFARLSC